MQSFSGNARYEPAGGMNYRIGRLDGDEDLTGVLSVEEESFTNPWTREMYAAGFRWLLIGFESGAPRILENINKKATRDDNTRCLELAANAGLKVKALMSVGHPGETEEIWASSPKEAACMFDFLHPMIQNHFEQMYLILVLQYNHSLLIVASQ